MSIFRMLVVGGVMGLSSVGLGSEILLVFTAKWCGPCQQFKEDLKTKPEMVGDYAVEVVDVSQAKDMAKDFDVGSVPTFIVVKVADDDVIKATNVVKRTVGYEGPKKLKAWLDR